MVLLLPPPLNEASSHKYSSVKYISVSSLSLTGRNLWSSSKRPERRRRDSAKTWKSLRTSSLDKMEGKGKRICWNYTGERAHWTDVNMKGFFLPNLYSSLNVCCLVAIEMCRRRTAPHWQRNTANTSTLKPNCDCWKFSSARETQPS